MTETEWLDCTEVVRQNEFLLTKGQGRKLQLFLCACCRRVYAHGYPGVDPNNPHLLARRVERAAQWKLLVEIFEDTSRRSKINPAWLTPTVKQLAESIYNERAFERLPILAVALTDAGCDNQDILNHCRQPGVHVKGCWPLDLVLGKE